MNLLRFLTSKFYLPKIRFKNHIQDPEISTLNLRRLQLELENDLASFLRKTEPLSDKDFEIIGKAIQIYCSSDLNARRTINAIRKASHGSDKQNAGTLQDKQLYEKLEETVKTLPDGNLKDGLIRAAKTIAMHHQRRHDFAHWVLRKVANEPVYFLCSNDERNFSDRFASTIGPGEMRYGLMSKPELLTEIRKLAGHCEYLAHRAASLEANFDKLKEHYDQVREDDRRVRYEAAKSRTDKRGI